MSSIYHDYLVQAIWIGANGRQYCIEFGIPSNYLWMLSEIAIAIDPRTECRSGIFNDMGRPNCFQFGSQRHAEIFVDSALTLPPRLLKFLRGGA